MINFDGQIGTLDWEACGNCIHSPPDADCEVGGPAFEHDGDFVYCWSFEEGEWRSKEQIEQERLEKERADKIEKTQLKLHKDFDSILESES